MLRTLIAVSVSLFCIADASGQLRPIQQLNPGLSNPNSNNAQDGLSIASRGTILAAVWADQAGTGSGTQDIYFAASNDEGQTWTVPSRVDVGESPNVSDSSFPQVAICDDPSSPGNLVYVVAWEESRLYGTSTDDIFVTRSADGVNWDLSTPLNVGVGLPTSDVDRLWIASAGTAAYLVWEEDGVTPDDCDSELLYFTRSLDAGLAWDAAVIMNNVTVSGAEPCDYLDIDDPTVVADGDRVVITWVDPANGDDDVWVAASNNKGAPNTFVKQAIESSQPGDIDTPETSIDGDRVVVAWQDDELFGMDDDEIHVAISNDGGVTWQAEVNVTPTIAAVPGSGTQYHDIAVSGPNIYVAFCSDHGAASLIIPSTGQAGVPASGENSQVREGYVSWSNDFGQTWNFEYTLDPGRANQLTRIKAKGTTAVVHMETEQFGNNELAYAVSVDGQSFKLYPNAETIPGDVDSRGIRQGENFVLTNSLIGQSVYWSNAPFFQNEPFTTGIRLPYVEITGTPSPGNNVSFGVRSAGSTASGGQFFVFLGVTGPGFTPITPNVFMPLSFDAVTFLTLGNPAALTLLSGSLDVNGDGSGPSFPWPAGVAPGLSIYTAGLITTPGGAPILTTDTKVLVTQ